MEKPEHAEEQLEEARRPSGTRTPERLDDEARLNLREFFSILQVWDEECKGSQTAYTRAPFSC